MIRLRCLIRGHNWQLVLREPAGHTISRCARCGQPLIEVNAYAEFQNFGRHPAEGICAGLEWPRYDPWELMTGHVHRELPKNT